MTSWRVTSSISSTFAFSKLAWSRIHWASSLEIPILPSSAWASQARDLDLLPNGVLVLEGEDVSHLRAGIAIDHSGSFLVIGTLVVTHPLYRAQVQVWAAGINLTFWNWSGQWGRPRICFANPHRLQASIPQTSGKLWEQSWAESSHSRNLPRSMERATGRLRICFANTHRLQVAYRRPSPARYKRFAFTLTLAPCRVRVPALY